MPIAVFASKVFDVSSDRIYTFGEFKYTGTLETEKQDADRTKPSTYNKGPGLSSITIKLPLDAAHGVNPRRELDEWEAIKDKGVAYPFILGQRPMGQNKYLLVSVQADEAIIDNKGNILLAELTLKFDEYVRAGKKPAATGASAPGLTQAQIEALLNPNAADKAALKRGSPMAGMTPAQMEHRTIM